MNIVHVVNGNDFGGSMTQIKALITSQVKKHNILLVVISDGPVVNFCKENKIDVTVFEPTFFGVRKTAKFLISISEDTDIFHLHGLKPMYAGAMASKDERVNTVATIHSDFYEEYRGNKLRYHLAINIIKWSVKRIDKFITVSEKLLKLLYDLDVKKENVTFIANGINVDKIEISKTKEEFLKAHGIDYNDELICGIAVRMHPVKNIDMVLKVANRLKDDNILFLIAGVGDEHYMSNLIAKAAELSLKKLHFIGFVKDIYNFFNAIDINMLTSREEGGPYSLMEAGALGKPLVSTNVGAMKTFIDKGEDGLVVELDDDESYAKEILALYNNADERLRLGKNLQTKIMTKFTNTVMSDNYDSLYNTFFKEEK